MNTASATDLQNKIHQSIPLSQAMGYRITALADTRITVEAPLEPNTNIHGTGFAGSLYALGILAAWGLCTHMIARVGLDASLVVAEAAIRYLAPVRGDIVCHCTVTETAARAFVDELTAQGRSRIALEVTIGDEPGAVIQTVMHASQR